VAAGTLFVGAIVTVTAIVLLFQTYFEHTLRVG
jgi:hypothetical protein